MPPAAAAERRSLSFADRVACHEGQQISVVASYGSRSKAEAVLARYRSGSSVTVHYDPANPSRSMLEPGVRGSVYLMLLVAVGCLVVATLIGISAIRQSSV